MKKLVFLFVLLAFLVSCVPSPEELAGVTREELASGTAVEKLIAQACEKEPVFNDGCRQTLADAHERERIDVAENTWDELREGEPRVLDGGAIEAGVGEKFKVSVK